MSSKVPPNMDVTPPEIEKYFATTLDPAITIEIIHRFQDWAEEVVAKDTSNLESLFESLANLIKDHLQIPRITIWDNNTYGESLVLQASVPSRDLKLAHAIPIKGTHTGQAVERRDIIYSEVLNPVLVGEGITQMITLPVLNLTRAETVALVINLYYRTGERPFFPISKEEARRLLSRFSTVLQNQIYKRDNEIESKVRNIAASAKGISSLFDGISQGIQKITHCSFAILFSWNETEEKLVPEGFFLAEKDKPASDLLIIQQTKENYALDELRIHCIEKKIPYVYREEVELPEPVTADNPVTVLCKYVAVPIMSSDGKTIGVLACGDPSEKARLAPSFSSLDVHAMQRFSGALSPAFERILVTRQEGRLIKTIKSVSDSMLQTQGIKKNLQSAIEAIVETLNSEVGSLYMRKDNTDIFEMRAAKGSNEKLIGQASYKVGEGITGTIAEGEVINFKSREELIAHPKYSGKYDQEIWGNRPDQKETFLGVPIMVEGKVKGLWKVSNVVPSEVHPDRYYTDEDMQIAQVLSSFMSYAIQNQEQEEKRLKQFTSLAKTSLEIQEATSEEEAIISVIGSLEEIEITGMLFSLFDPQSGELVGNEVLGSIWKRPASQYKCHIDDEYDVRARVLTSNQEVVTDLLLQPGQLAPGRYKSKQFVLPLRLEDELIGTLQFDVETAKLNERRQLILKAFASHLAISISRLRSINQTFELTNKIMASSRFLVAQTVSTMAVHTVHHKLKDIHKQLNEALEKRQIKENRLLLDTLGDWSDILDGLVAELEDIVTFVSASSEQESIGPTDVHPEIQATISTWYNYLRGHKSRVLRPQLQAASSVCLIPAQAFKEILAVLIVNSVQAHAKNIEIKTYNRTDVQVHRDPLKKHTISAAFCLDCCDDGVGLVAGTSETIFDSSYTTKPSSFGSGLGLFIARELARNAGGDLEVKETDQSKGVTFQLTLPVEETQ